jgi:SnoaL-like domain
MDRHASRAMERARIAATVRAYATGVDLRDFDLLSRVFADTIDVDFTSWEPKRSAATVTYDRWAAGARPQLIGLDSTLHAIRDPRMTIHGDEAVSVGRMRAEHYLLSDPAETSAAKASADATCPLAETSMSAASRCLAVAPDSRIP